jgi:hypothetical protein
VLAVATLVVTGFGVTTGAQDRSALLRVLNSNADFRVRVQAAFALGNAADVGSAPALEEALRDEHPAVRAAAATSLGRLGARRSLAPLSRARRDRSQAVRMQVDRAIVAIQAQPRVAPSGVPGVRVRRAGGGFYPAITVVPTADEIPWPRIRYVVSVGTMRNASGFAGEDLTGLLRSEVMDQLQIVRGVAVMPNASAIDRRARNEIRRRRLPHLRLDGSVAGVQRQRRGRELSVRCEVALMLVDGHAQSIRGELRGAATGSAPPRRGNRGQQEQQLAAQALSGAVRSAMSGAQQAFAAAARR